MLKRSLFALLLAALGVGTLAAPAQAAVTYPSTYFQTISSQNGPAFGDDDYLWRNGDGSTMEVREWIYTGMQVAVWDGPDYANTYFLHFNPTTTEDLAVGEYDNVQAHPDETHGSIRVTGCDTLSGRFDVKDIAADWSHFWITFEVDCVGGGTVFGEVRAGLPALDPELTVAPTAVDWPTSGGRDRSTVPVNLVNTDTDPVTVSAAVVSGDDEFSVVGNSCAVIPAGGRCRIEVEYAPTTAGTHTGNLTITDSTTAGSHTVPLSGEAVSVPVTAEFHLNKTTAYKYGETVTATATINGTWVDPTVSIYTGAEPRTLIGTGTVDVDGTFSVSVPVKVKTTFTMEWSDGEAGGLLVRSASVTPVKVTLATDHSFFNPYTYGASAQVTVRLTGATHRNVRIYKRVGSGARKLIALKTVSASSGKVTVAIPVYEMTAFSADWVDGANRFTSGEKKIKVYPKIVSTMTQYVGKIGTVSLYRPGQRMWVRTTVAPPKPNRCVSFTAKAYLSGSWRTVATTGCVPLTSSGAVQVYLPYDKVLLGKKLSFSALFKGDGYNAGRSSLPVYAKWVS